MTGGTLAALVAVTQTQLALGRPGQERKDVGEERIQLISLSKFLNYTSPKRVGVQNEVRPYFCPFLDVFVPFLGYSQLRAYFDLMTSEKLT